ncbi:hypothetical protein [Armatimonas sp.]|uniref:hypothetical protein n=1 Tax=Armatimonas sp. TaxID=1872638 RepID=UPI00374CCC24
MIHLLFFKGYGIIPILVRLLTWHWWLGQRWSQVPAHVAIAIPVGSTLSEYEAIITGVHVALLAPSDVPRLNGLIAAVPVEVPQPAATQRWLDAQVGKPYGYLAAAATGLGIISPPWLDRWWRRGWERLSGGKSGRTAPLNCSLLCQLALGAGGLDTPGRQDGLPVSPNDLMRILQT